VLSRPEGSTEHSPGLRPKADALGLRHFEINRALKGRHKTITRTARQSLACSVCTRVAVGIMSRIMVCSARGVAPSGQHNVYHCLTQAIGLRPQAWAMLGRPVGPRCG
jgi:hypothetical protein